MTSEIVFLVEPAPEGGYTARALGESIFTEADTVEEMHDQVRDACVVILKTLSGQRRSAGTSCMTK